MEGYQQGSGRGREGEKVQGISSINGREKIDRGRLRIVEAKKLICIGNIEAKELIRTTHGHELRARGVGGRYRWEGVCKVERNGGEMGQL